MSIFDKLTFFVFRPWLNPDWEKRAAGVVKLRNLETLIAIAVNDPREPVREAALGRISDPEALVKVLLGATWTGATICGALKNLQEQHHLERLARPDFPNTAREAIANKLISGCKSGTMKAPLGKDTVKFILENGTELLDHKLLLWCEKLIEESFDPEELVTLLTSGISKTHFRFDKIKSLYLKALAKLTSQDDIFAVAQHGGILAEITTEALQRLENRYAENLAIRLFRDIQVMGA